MANTSLTGKCHSLSRAALSAATRKERKKRRVEDLGGREILFTMAVLQLMTRQPPGDSTEAILSH